MLERTNDSFWQVAFTPKCYGLEGYTTWKTSYGSSETVGLNLKYLYQYVTFG